MATCARCGADLHHDDRFCRSCGAPVPGRGGTSLFGAASPSAGTTSEAFVVTQRNESTVAWLVVLGAVLAVVVGFAVLRGGSDEASEPALTLPPDVTVAPTSTRLPTTTASTTTVPAVSTSAARGALIPALPDATGVTLVAGDPLTLIDLDTGQARETTITEAGPVAVVADRLVYLEAIGTLASVPIDRLDDEPLRYDIDGVVVSAVAARRAGAVQATVQRQDDGALYSYDIDVVSGEILTELPIDIDDLFALGFQTDAEFRSPRTGGVYRRTATGWRREIDGAVIAGGAGYVLVEQCDGELACDLRWFTSTLEPVDLFIPEEIATGEVLDGGRAMIVQTTFEGPQSLIDLRTGDVLAARVGDFGSARSVSVDPSGRYITYLDGEMIGPVVFDIATGTRHRLRFQRTTNLVDTPLLFATPG